MNAETSLDRARALTAVCPLCDAEPALPCRNRSTGQPLRHLPAHNARLRAASVMHALDHPRDLLWQDPSNDDSRSPSGYTK